MKWILQLFIPWVFRIMVLRLMHLMILLALSNFKSNYYSLVILDINMPKMNGYDLYKEIRKLDNKVKICFFTASELYNESLRSQTKETLDEVKRFISKPLTIEDLIKVKKELAEDS